MIVKLLFLDLKSLFFMLVNSLTFALTIDRRKGKEEREKVGILRNICSISILFAVCSSVFNLAGAQELQVVLGEREIINNTVSITAKYTDGSTRDGFGFIVSLIDEVPLIATANHVIRDGKNLASEITIRYFYAKGQTYQAKATEIYDPELDVAVIAAASVRGFKDIFQPEPMDCATNIMPGSAVWYVGRAGEWYTPPNPGSFVRLTTDNKLLLYDLDISEGTSGAPLITKKGIAGMVLGARGQSDTGIALPIDMIKSLVEGKVFDKKGRLVSPEQIAEMSEKELAAYNCEDWERDKIKLREHQDFLKKETFSSDCENCDQNDSLLFFESKHQIEQLLFLISYLEQSIDMELCQNLKEQGFPKMRSFYEINWLIPPDCGCVPIDPSSWTDYSDGYTRFSGEEYRRMSCTSKELKDLFADHLKPGARMVDIYNHFEPTHSDLSAIFDDEILDQIKTAYKDEIRSETESDERVEQVGLVKFKFYSPNCIRIPAHVKRTYSGAKINPTQDVVYCEIEMENPLRNDKMKFWGFFYVNGHWVWLPDFTNYLPW